MMHTLFSIEQAAEQLDLPRRTLYNYWQQGLIPCIEQNGVARVTPATIQLLAAVLAKYGRRGIRDGIVFAGASPVVAGIAEVSAGTYNVRSLATQS